MLLHLPIVILTTFSPVAVSDTVPQFDVARECRFEGGTVDNVDRCSQDEIAALKQLHVEWTQVSGTDKNTCLSATLTGGFTSYVELLTCLEMAHDARQAEDGSPVSQTADSIRPADGRVTVGVGHGAVSVGGSR